MTDTLVGVYRRRVANPNAPAQVTGVTLSGTKDPNPDTVSFKVTFDAATVPTGSAPVSSYRVYVDGQRVPSPYTATRDVLVTNSDFLPLNPGSTHTVQVSAVNLYGEGPKSDPYTVTMGVGGQPPAPVVALGAVTGTTVGLSWGPVLFDPPPAYEVFNAAAPSVVVLTTTAGAAGATVTGLTTSTDYGFTVKALDLSATDPTLAESVPSNTVHAHTGTGGSTGVIPLPADDVVEAYGVNWHGSQNGTYGHDQTLTYAQASIDHVTAMGCRYIRDRMMLPYSAHIAGVHTHFINNGGRLLLLCGADRAAGTSLGAANTHMDAHYDAIQAAGASYVAGIEALEGINEPNNDSDAAWFTKTRLMQQALWERVKLRNSGPTRLDLLPVLGPALANRLQSGHPFPETFLTDFAALGDLTAWCDHGTLHAYDAGGPAGARLIPIRDASAAAFPGLPFQTTETGYFDWIKNYTGGSQPVPDDVQAVYGPRLLMENIMAGAERVFLYEGLDDPIPTDPTAHLQATFGLVRTPSLDQGTWVRKKQWYAMCRFLHLMADGSTPTLTPFPLVVTGGGPNFRWQLRRKSDGKYYLILWRNERLYQQNYKQGSFTGGTYLTVTPVNAAITLPSAMPVALHKPSTQGTATTSTPYTTLNAASFNVPMDGELQVAVIG